jgi:hypothetical protein
MVTADGMRRRARASAAAHFAASAGSRGKASYEKACHRAWAVMVGRVYSISSAFRESNDVKPSDDELGFLSCREIVDYCLDFLSGSLPDREKQLFSSHLRNCPECMKFFETYRRTPEISREALALSMPDRVRVAVRDYLRERYEPSSASDNSSSRR